MAAALGRVVNFEMCHLRSLGRVANFKNEAFRNGGIYRIWFFGVFNMLHMLSYDHQGGCGECINVLDEYFPYVTEHAHVAHAVVWSSGGWGGVLTSLTSTSLTLWNTLLHKKNNKFTKKIHLGLQLDMASQCCLVAVCGFCVATSALALKRREEEKIGRVNVALILFGWLKIIDF